MLQNRRILVVEDDFQVAESLAEMLATLGCDVVGPAATVDEACDIIEANAVDAAVLDVALLSGTSAAIARALRKRHCPYLFLTGFADATMLPEDLRDSVLLLKPVDSATMLSAILDLLKPLS